MVGIDKLQLTTKDFQVRDATPEIFGMNLSTQQGKSELPYLLTDSKGRAIHAKSIYHNSKVGQYSINPFGLQVQFNPSGIFHPYYLTSTGGQFNQAIKLIQDDLAGAGILCNLEQMKFSRIDLTAQEQMNYKPGQYSDVFRMFRGKRARKKGEYETGYTIGNGQWETIGYDKLQAMIDNSDRKVKFDQSVFPEKNLLRIENRWLNSKIILSNLPFNTITAIQQTTPNDLIHLYKKHLQGKVFNMAVISEQLQLDFAEQGKIFRQIMSKHSTKSKGAISHLMVIADAKIEDAILLFGGLDGYRQFLVNEGGMSRKHSYTLIRDIEKFINDSRMSADQGVISTAAMLNELQQKFIA